LSRPRIRILAGVDFSPESRRALHAARSLARSADATITIAHVRPLSDVKAAVVEERGDLLRRADGSLGDALADHFSRRLARLTGSRAGERTLLLRGAPGLALCREARRGYDLLVLGNRGRGRVAAALLGSTVQEALSGAPIPVLVVRGPAPRPQTRFRGRSR
jgi:nucleotide-binding universal stress UspA family protein